MRTKLFTLIFFLLSLNFYSQIGFQNHIIIDDTYSANDAHSVYSGDLDGDGDIDVISAARSNNKISWFKNIDGLGNFEQKIITTSASSVESVYTSDIDDDGDLDILYGSYAEVAWYENVDGLGTFSVRHIITTEVQYAPTAITNDIDGDGDLDVVSASWGLDEIAWYENIDSKGGFGPKQLISTIDNGWSIFAADIDGDGDNDLLSAPGSSSTYKIYWFENTDGLGSFSAEKTISSTAYGARSIYAADIDGDNDMDLVLGTENDNKVTWFENTDGLGGFVLKQVLSSDVDAKSVKVADIDGDGDLDVISASFQDDKISWFENTDGLGNFGLENIISAKANGARTVHFEDLDGDGDIDVISGSGVDNKIAWYENLDGLGTFGDQKEMTINVNLIEAVVNKDIDGDGDLDVISASRYDSKIAWYENTDGKGAFGKQYIISNDALNVQTMDCIDVDNDGDNDLVAASFQINQEIFWFENIDGLGTFSTKKIISTEVQNTTSVFGVDLDNDGYKDLVSASSGDNKIAWYRNLGNGAFESQSIISNSINGANFVYSVDIDGDNDMDVIATSKNDNKVVWFENTDGLGGFGSENIVEVGFYMPQPKSVKSFDIDGDGDLDIVTNSNAAIKWFENTDGLGTFELKQQIMVNDIYPGKSLYGIDVDLDGDLDVVSTIYQNAIPPYEYLIVWFENTDGLGTFGVRQTISNGLEFNIGDIDLDGDVDFISTSSSQKIEWIENVGVTKNEINGIVRLDLNANGCDQEDSVIPNLMITTNNGVDTFSTFTSNNGFYQLFPVEGNYSTYINSPIQYYTSSPISDESNFIGIGNTETVNFCLEPMAGINDVSISVFPVLEPRPNSERFYHIVFQNIGTTTLDGDIGFVYDNNKMEFLSADAPLVSQTPNTLTFEYNNLSPMESRGIEMLFHIFSPPQTNIDDILNFSAFINPTITDENVENNTIAFNQTVVDSFDPNDISVLEGNEVLIEDTNKYLHYTIRFQNTGTAEAINIFIENVLDSNFDWNSFQLVESSHEGRVEIKNGNEVKFIFNGIYLPDSTDDEPNSHGFISYKIKPKGDVVVGDIMTNQADIYFDFNPAITTNMVTTEITSLLSTDEYLISKFHLYPNPTTGMLNISSESQISSLKIYNNIGQVILSSFNNKSIDISSLRTGLYFIKVEDTMSNVETKKIIKK